MSENAIRTQADEIRLSADALIVFVNDNKSLDKTNGTFYSDTYRVDITISNFGLYDKKRPKISCTPFIYYSFGQKLFDDKKSAFVAALIAPLKRVRRMVISVGFVKTVNAIL